MLKMKYLWLAALVALCATLCVGSAYAQDHWAVALDEEDPPGERMDFPSSMLWDETTGVSFDALNDGSTTWDTDYDFRSVEGVTPTLGLTARWCLTLTPASGITPTVAPDETHHHSGLRRARWTHRSRCDSWLRV